MLLSRRKFLGGVSVSAICLNLPVVKTADAALHRGQFTFQGNPNVITSSVDVNTNGIVALNTSGTIPFFCPVSASGVLCTGINLNGNPVLPFEDLMFSFSINDANADTVTNPTNTLGIIQSTATQYGPEAVFCIRIPGTYTITMTVWYQIATGSYASVQKTLSVTALDASVANGWTIRYADPNATGANTGLTPTDAWTSTDPTVNINPFFAGGAKRKLFLAQGGTWTCPASSSFTVGLQNASGARLDSFVGAGGAGAKPIILAAGAPKSAQNSILYIPGVFGTSVTAGDVVVSNIQVINSGGSTASACAGFILGSNSSSTLQNIYLDNVDLINHLNTSSFMNWEDSGTSPTTFAGMGFWKCTFPGDLTLTNPRHSFFGGSQEWLSFLGCSFSGTGNLAGFDHHVYPECALHGCYRWNTFGETGATTNTQRNYCVNLNLQVSGDVAIYHLFADNCFGPINLTTGGAPKYGHDVDNVNNSPNQVTGNNIVFERNFVKGLTTPFLYTGCSSETIRFSNFYGLLGSAFQPGGSLAGVLKSQHYKNNHYIISSASGEPFQFSNYVQTFSVNTASPCTFTCTTSGAAFGSIPVGTPVILSNPVGSLSAGTYYVATAVFGSAWALQLTTVKGSTTPNVNNTGATGNVNLTTSWQNIAQTVTDNVILDNRTTPLLFSLSALSQFNSSGNSSLIDRNQYSWSGAPSTQTPFSGNSYATWSGSPNLFDTHATFTVPSWSNPANGIFS